MKIGILTFHSASNYGAVLQCYALQEFLRKKNHDAYIIDYRPNYLEVNKKKRITKIIINIIKTLIFKGNYKRLNPFNSFINNRLRLFPITQINETSQFDAIICGSDQIWNSKICGGNYDKMYFADFPPAKKSIRISYAASMGSTQMDIKKKEEFRQLLQNFNYISVREESLKTFISKEFGINSKVVLDPTLLVEREIFDQIAKTTVSQKPYVLIYEIQHVEGLINIAKKIANEINANVIQLNGNFSTYLKPGIKNVQGRTPEEFISYFKHAAFVVTTSFHGTAFSIMYKKPFYAIRQENERDIRIHTLLSSLNLLDRFINKNTDVEFKELEYKRVEIKMQDLRKHSQDYLDHSLNSPQNE